ncbi:MAG TPA: exosortase W [Vicinamibacterales bacterium]|jgi:EpsI family protein
MTSVVVTQNPWRPLPLRVAAGLLATAVAFSAAYGGAIRILVSRWYTDDFYSYGFLIPFISVYIVWMERKRVVASVGAPDYLLGLPMLALSLSALLVGQAGSFAVLQPLSIVPALGGLIALSAGRRALRTVLLPLLYLTLAVPVWDIFTDRLHEPFQQISARIGLALMGAMGVPAYLNDKVLQLPNITLEVARACSGVNYLISVVAIAIPYSYLSLSRMTRRVAVISFAVVVAILSNGARVAFIGALQYYQLSGPEDLHGPYHTLQGMFVAVAGYVALFVGARLMREPDAPAPDVGVTRLPAVAAAAPRWTPVVLGIGLLSVAAILVPYADPRPVALADARWWPEAIGEWRLGEADLNAAPIRAARPDVEFCREYRAPGRRILVYIAYFAVQQERRKIMGFGGIALPDSARRVVLQTADGGGVHASGYEETSPTGGQRYVIGWYDLGGTVVGDVYRAKLVTLWNSVFHRRSNGAVVALTLDGPLVPPPDKARALLQSFASQLLPAARDFVGAGARPR